jgi:hypothetical protein
MKKQDAREIVDGQTGEIVAHAIGLIAALRKCDRLDKAYGAIRYYQRPATGETKCY